jgi:hypothetical protein
VHAVPALPSPGQVLRVAFYTSDEAAHASGSRFYLTYTGGKPGGGDLTTLASDIATAWSAHVASVVCLPEFLSTVNIIDLSSDTGAEGTWTGHNAGTLGGSQLPASAAAVVNHIISRRYRGGRPRTYLRAGTQGTMQGTNEWTAAFQSSVLTAWQGWIGAILALTGFGFALAAIVNVSYFKGFTAFEEPSGRYRNIPTPRATPVIDAITSSTVGLKIGTQRRRLDL